jgi:hypothetical protein
MGDSVLKKNIQIVAHGARCGESVIFFLEIFFAHEHARIHVGKRKNMPNKVATCALIESCMMNDYRLR